ncbi:hypothetical protein [Rhodococcus erythropolis]|uniref:hypothetical protein n=1 Tax=Rhodococcus erythropolis TaxID=1833 RepID=UPI001BEB5D19|nr:hypothetical protein [Rhodococcus erythropolis]MBT2263484.1 hypothetical protein [Rhodococcus erythropolis]
MDEMSGWVMAEYRSICLLDDPPADLDVPSAEDVDDYLPPPDAPEGFDLVTAAPGVVTVSTGVMRGKVHLTVHVLDSEPRELAAGDWETVEEIGFRALSAYTHAAAGNYYPFAATSPGAFERSATPAGAGFYRVRAHELNRGKNLGEHRDDNDPPTEEQFLLQVWPTPTEDEDRRRLVGREPPLML